ncbi:MAG: dephospho-CoA kinase [Lachnospiraceae bacterium]|nr:dephospho-CoA kinase [Lachnospiraceae bacterium]
MEKTMRVIGVTGGVGAGKSMVLEFLKKEHKAKLFCADEIGRELMKPDGACFAPVVRAFGEAVVKADGELDRGEIAKIVFGDEEALGRLNGIIHPAVRREIETGLEELKEEELAVIESAILLEAGYEDICEEIWYVYAKEETRINRLMESRGYSRERCLEVMKSQMGEEELRRRATAVIENDGDKEAVREQIQALLKTGSEEEKR